MRKVLFLFILCTVPLLTLYAEEPPTAVFNPDDLVLWAFGDIQPRNQKERLCFEIAVDDIAHMKNIDASICVGDIAQYGDEYRAEDAYIWFYNIYSRAGIPDQSEGKEVLLYVIGKKAISFYNFTKTSMFRTVQNKEDKFSFDDAAKLGEELTKFFVSGEIHEVYISYTKVISFANQRPEAVKLLPIAPEMEIDYDALPSANMDYIFEPNPAEIFSYILPLYLKVKLYTCFLESSYSEHFARRVAMKNATDAAKDMIKELTVTYNRVRQDKITTEISEIVGGAAALE